MKVVVQIPTPLKDLAFCDHFNCMATAIGQGDTKSIYESVRELAGNQGKPACNLVTDGKGNPLQNAKEVAGRWYNFLSKKFEATKKEENRTLQKLPSTVGNGSLTRMEIITALRKLKAGKATGPDNIPTEISAMRGKSRCPGLPTANDMER